MTSPRNALVVAAAALLLAGACSSGSDPGPAASDAPAETDETETAAAGEPAEASDTEQSETESGDTESGEGDGPEPAGEAADASDEAAEAEPVVAVVDETLELDRGPYAPSVDSHVPSVVPDEAIGRAGFTRYVYVNSAGRPIPALVEGPAGSQIRCQDPALPCSYLDLVELLESGEAVPEELGMTREEVAGLVIELKAVEDAIASFPDAATACAAGYEPDRTQTANMGSHFVNYDLIVDGLFAPGEPEIIMFARVGNAAPEGPLGRCVGDTWEGVDVEPVGVAYFQPIGFVGDDHFEGFTGPLDNWHVHYNLCRLDGQDVTVPADVCNAQNGTVGEFEENQIDTAPTGDASEGWMIHAWADPDHDNQLGAFSMWNPSIWPVSDPTAILQVDTSRLRAAGTEVVDDFTLPDIELDRPGRVTFFNADGVAHTITAGTPVEPSTDLFDSGIVGSRQAASIDLTDTGEFSYYCSLHPDMQATISVG